jgi:predicted acylesterase/phospholipase RssA
VCPLARVSGSAIGLIVCGVLIIGAPIDAVHAQHPTAAKKRTESKPPAQVEKRRAEERIPFTQEDDEAASVPGIPQARAWGDSAAEFARLLPPTTGPASGTWLAISGGGSDGAFSAGILAGWTQAGTRPEFSVVTGVSIGSLIAPFAFLGPRYDNELRTSFTTISAADIFEDQPTRDSLFDYWPLRRLIEQRITAKLLAEIATEHARGRRLFVVTTNLDAGRRVVWNMGAIAIGADERALKLFREVLLASCSIPGFFSPVAITVEVKGNRFDEMHGDGTLTAPFFVMPEGLIASDARPGLAQVYVIVNSKLGPEFKMAERNVGGVLGRSIGVALTSALQSEVSLLSVAAQRLGFALQIAHIDPVFSYPSRGPFDGKYMQALYEFGLAAGQKGTVFENAGPGLSLRRSSAQ